jgi:hypothetical protein
MSDAANDLPSIKSDDDLLRVILGDKQSGVHRLPHLVMPSWKRSLEVVLDTLHCAAGVWGDYPLSDEGGAPNLLDPGSVDCWRLWKAEANQTYVREHGFHAKLGCFTAVIDSETSWDVINTLRHAVPKNAVPFIQDILPAIVRNIDRLRWTYMPLWDEVPLAMFVMRPEDAQLVSRIKEILNKEQIPHSRIVKEGQKETWNLGARIRRLCGLEGNA